MDLYGEAVKMLTRATEALDTAQPGDEFDRAYDGARISDVAVERAKDAYDRHVAEHGCGPVPDSSDR